MGIVQLIFSVLGLVFAVLSLLNTLPYDITPTPMFFCLAMAALAGAIEDKRKGRKKMAWFGLLVGIFILAVLAGKFVR